MIHHKINRLKKLFEKLSAKWSSAVFIEHLNEPALSPDGSFIAALVTMLI